MQLMVMGHLEQIELILWMGGRVEIAKNPG
jgi:hypothetical protein